MPGSKMSGNHSNPQANIFDYGEWKITVKKSHILPSKCTLSDSGCEEGAPHACLFCRYEKALAIPQFPDMVFAENLLRIERHDGVGMEFNSLDALKPVTINPEGVKVASSDAWREARADSEYINQVAKPFDWTFTTDYKGTILGNDKKFQEVPTTQKIDLEKLKQREAILFYDEIDIFEDELSDHGCSSLSVKIRVMPSGFFILQRFYLRIDNVLLRIHDTRLYYETSTNYILREYTTRESKYSELGNLPHSVITDSNEICPHLKLKEEILNRLEIPALTN
ncbi:hypothetical protein CHUAL_011429 [Chamberlinius hualienensis]